MYDTLTFSRAWNEHMLAWFVWSFITSFGLFLFLIYHIDSKYYKETGEKMNHRDLFIKVWLRGLFFSIPVIYIVHLLFGIFYGVGFFRTVFSIQMLIVCGFSYIGHIIFTSIITGRVLGQNKFAVVTQQRGLNDGRLSETLKTQAEGILIYWLEKAKKGDFWLQNVAAKRADINESGIVFGSSGSGKTSFLLAQAIDWMRTGHPIVIVDVKPELWGIMKEKGILEQYGYRDYVFNPTDKTSLRYNVFNEWDGTVANMRNIIDCYMSTSSDDHTDANAFKEGASDILTAIMLHLGEKRSLPEARKFISNARNGETLFNYLLNSQNMAVKTLALDLQNSSENKNLFASIYSTLSRMMNKFILDETVAENISSSDFKFDEITRKEKVIIFLQFEQNFKAVTQEIYAATVAQLFRILIRNLKKRNPVFLQIDEITNANRIPDLEGILSLIRSANIPTWLYLQNISKLKNRYGKYKAEMILNSSPLKLCFNVDDSNTAEVFVNLLGKDVTTFSSHSSTQIKSTRNPHIGANSESVSYSHQILNVADVNDFQGLPVGKAVVLYRGVANYCNMPVYYRDYPIEPGRATLERPSEIYTSRCSSLSHPGLL